MGTVKFWIILVFPITCVAQYLPLVQDYGMVTDPGFAEWVEEFVSRTQNPVNLYEATEEDLLFLPWISPLLARRILKEVAAGHINSLEDLCRFFAASWQCELFQRLFVLEVLPPSRSFVYRLRWGSRFPPVSQIHRGTFQGDLTTFLHRLTVTIKEWQGFLQFAKDPGEPLQYAALQGTFWRVGDRWKVVVGDFGVRLGLGNLLWYGLGNWKSTDVISPVLRFAVGIYPFRSTFAGMRFRGIAAEYRSRPSARVQLCLLGWGSYRKRSGSIDSLGVVTSINVGETFRTQSEIRGRHSFQEYVAGAGVELRHSAWRVGTAIGYFAYDHPIHSQSRYSPPYQQWLATTVFAQWRGTTATIGGELTLLPQGQQGIRLGYQQRLSSQLRVAVATRYFSSQYRSPWGTNFGQWTPPGNEIGVYTGIQMRLRNSLWYFYSDLFQSLQPQGGHFYRATGVEVRMGWRQQRGRYPIWVELRGQRKVTDQRQSTAFALVPQYDLQAILQFRAAFNRRAAFLTRIQFIASFEHQLSNRPTGYGIALINMGRFASRFLQDMQFIVQVGSYALSNAELWIWEPGVQAQWNLARLARYGIDIVGVLRWTALAQLGIEFRWKYRLSQMLQCEDQTGRPPCWQNTQWLTVQITTHW